LQTELTAFRASVRTSLGVDLTAAPFDEFATVLASPDSYAETQALGAAMRAAGIEAFRFVSARDVQGGVNVGVFAPAAFGRRAPKALETWHCVATRASVELVRRDYFKRASFQFPRNHFLVGDQLPSPAL
jgi:hypothetical protein